MTDNHKHLAPTDVVSTSISQPELSSDQDLYKRKSIQEFGDLFKLYAVFTQSTGLELPTDLSNKLGKEPTDWIAYYNAKKAAMEEADNDVLLSQGNREYKEAQKQLKSRKDEVNYSTLIMVASKMFWILDMLPSHAGCYHVLSYILFTVNRLEAALEVLNMGRIVDPTFVPFKELEEEIISTVGNTPKKEAPVLVNDSLSPEILKVLLELFQKFDEDMDGCLNSKELDFYVFSTNGQHPPQSFIDQMGERFGADENGALTKKGFLAFYLEQTLGDPSETRRDMIAHGYDGSTLEKVK